MIGVDSLRFRIVLQFLLIVLPISLVLGYQVVFDVHVQRSREMERAFRLQGLSRTVRSSYKTFVVGVVDAVDTERISSKAVAALEEARAQILGLRDQDGTRSVAELLSKVDRILGVVTRDASIGAVLPLREMVNDVDRMLAEYDAAYEQDVQRAVASSGQTARTQKAVVLIASLATLLIGSFFTRIMIKGLTQPLNVAVKVANRIAGGKIATNLRLDTRRDIGHLLHSLALLNDSLAAMVGRVRATVEAVGASAAKIATGNGNLAKRTERQTASLEETSATMEKLRATVKGNAESARQGNLLAVGAQDVADRGGRVIGDVVATMESISESARKVVDIIGAIDSIAFQTNILALNAAVEAARAGQHGHGFAIVAGEVRSLALRSAEAAREIKGIVGESAQKVEQGSRLVADAGRTMREIVAAVKRVTDIMRDISLASDEQSLGIDQVNQTIGELEAFTQQNLTLVEEASIAAESLNEQALALAGAVRTFTLEAVPEVEGTESRAIAGEAMPHPRPA
jgi:methyl-accepting chemotaxis protein